MVPLTALVLEITLALSEGLDGSQVDQYVLFGEKSSVSEVIAVQSEKDCMSFGNMQNGSSPNSLRLGATPSPSLNQLFGQKEPFFNNRI